MADDEETTGTEEEQQEGEEGYEDAQSFGDYDDADDLLDAYADLAEEIDSHGTRLNEMLKSGQLDDPHTLAAEMVETVMNFLRDLSQISYDACVEAIEAANADDEPDENDPGRIAIERLTALGHHLAQQLHSGTEEEKKVAAKTLEMLGFDPKQIAAQVAVAEADTAPPPPLAEETTDAPPEEAPAAEPEATETPEAEATT